MLQDKQSVVDDFISAQAGDETQKNASRLQRFYCKNHLATEIQGTARASIVRAEYHAVAQQNSDSGAFVTRLLATDQQQSVLGIHGPEPFIRRVAYSPCGFRLPVLKSLAVLGFNGERQELVAQTYMLGNGYREFNPSLMRFSSPDSMSPFGIGGLNYYGYCLQDPINFQDPSGRFSMRKFLSRAYEWVARKVGFHKIAKGTGQLFETVTTSQTKTYTHLTRARSASAPLHAVRPLGGEVPKNWDLIGYHGSSMEYGPSLRSGLDPQYQGSSTALLFGKGFYLAPEPQAPSLYASSSILRNQTPAMYGVYTENLSRLRLGRDYSFRVRDRAPAVRTYGEIIIRKPAYHLIAVRSVRKGQVVLPRPNEASF